MPFKAQLVVDRMATRALYRRALDLTWRLSNYGHDSSKSSDVRAMAHELRIIINELHLRGDQLSLGADLGKRK